MANASDLSVQSLCSQGECSTKHVIEKGFNFEDKVYTADDALMIESAGFARTDIFKSTALDRSYNLGGETNAPIVTVIPGMKAGMQRSITAEHYEANWLGELDGRLANRCQFFPQTVRRVVETERIMCAKKVFVESELCASELIETRKDEMLLPGALNESNTSFLNEVVLDAFIEANHINIDRHAWRGDYGSSDDRIKHVDGYFKILHNAFQTSQGQILEFSFTGDLTDQCIVGLAGGQDFSFGFEDDDDTTVQKFATWLAGEYAPMLGRTLYKSVEFISATRTVRIEAWEGEAIMLNIAISGDCNAPIEKCPSDGSIKACVPSTTASYTCVEVQASVSCLSPIGVELKRVDENNVDQVLDDWYATVQRTASETLDQDFGANLLVARNIYYAYMSAHYNRERSQNTNGGTCNIQPCLQYKGIRLIPMNYMPDDCFMYASPRDLLVGVDLISDANNFEVWKERGCDTLRFKGAMSIGFNVRRVDKISGTFCDKANKRLRFRDLMPCSIKRDPKFYPVVQ